MGKPLILLLLLFSFIRDAFDEHLGLVIGKVRLLVLFGLENIDGSDVVRPDAAHLRDDHEDVGNGE
jgi:hypothetical protein